MNRCRLLLHVPAILVLLTLASFLASAQTQLSPELREKIDKLANQALAKSGVPSASVAVVTNGQIAYLQAYGAARLEPRTQATPDMRYSIARTRSQ
jgi:D-alanyl-D-alanine carboxypeptidase